jgi:hypothetical protein
MKIDYAKIITIGVAVMLFCLLVYRLKINTNNPTNAAQSTQLPEDAVHYHAGFQVYVNDELQDYSGIEFMHIEPCGLDEHDDNVDETNEQIEIAHLHDGIGDVVHVHRPGAVWGDLFNNINVVFPSPTEAYVNGEVVDNILNHPINEYDSMIILSGPHTNISEKLDRAVTLEHIIEAEAISETCGS